MNPLPTPVLERVADCQVQLGEPVDVGETPFGRRRLIPILGGRVFGPLLRGQVLPGGADFQITTSVDKMSLHARYVIETEQGERVYVENEGLRVAPKEVMARLNRGEPVDPSAVYCRTRPRFETASKVLAWLMSSTFIGTAQRAPDHVQLAFFRVL